MSDRPSPNAAFLRWFRVKGLGCLLVVVLTPFALVWAEAVMGQLWQRNGAPAVGRVTAFRGSDWTRTRRGAVVIISCPVVAFVDSAGRQREFVADSDCATNRSPSTLAVGATVPVLYDPEKPRRAVIDRFWSRWSMTIRLSAVVGFLLVGATVGWKLVARNAARG